MAFDPLSGNLWDQENGEDAFDEINLVEPGMNSGWIQIMGPSARVAEYKEIETTSAAERDLPQPAAVPLGTRAHRRHAARKRCRGCSCCRASRYSDPEFSWDTCSRRPRSASSTADRLGRSSSATCSSASRSTTIRSAAAHALQPDRQPPADRGKQDRRQPNVPRHERSNTRIVGATSASSPTSRRRPTATCWRCRSTGGRCTRSSRASSAKKAPERRACPRGARTACLGLGVCERERAPPGPCVGAEARASPTPTAKQPVEPSARHGLRSEETGDPPTRD